MRFIPPPELLDSPRGRRFGDGPPDAATPGDVPATTRVCVVGCGPAAVSLATTLWHRWGSLEDAVLLDPAQRPMQRFLDRMDALRQRVLRSPYEHHMGTHENRDCELLDYARCHWSSLTDVERGEVRRAMSGQRSVVPLDVFRGYVHHTVGNHDVAARHRRAAVRRVVPGRGGRGWIVEHDRGTTEAERVVFALGEETTGVPKSWTDRAPVTRWDAYRPGPAGRRVVVSGSGLSAAHVIADVCLSGSHAIWVQRGAERFQCADVNARFFRPEGRAGFRRLDGRARARALARHRKPTIMFEYRPLLERWQAEGCLTVHRGTTPASLSARAGGGVDVTLADGTRVTADDVVAAHGTTPARLPLERDQEDTGSLLPVVDDRTLELPGAAGLHVIGVHAALAVGPAARNLDGMRIAASLVADALDRPAGEDR